MTAKRAPRPATYEDLLAVPDTLVAEIIDGELVTTPRPRSPHALAATAIGADLFGRFHGPPSGDRPGGWWILFEPELHLGRDVVVPDLAGWRRERLPVMVDVAFFELAPDWVCEIASPHTARYDRVRKKRIYARDGVGHYWIVDPVDRTLEVLRLVEKTWQEVQLFEGNEPVEAEPFLGMTLDPARWWLPLPAPTKAPSGRRRRRRTG